MQNGFKSPGFWEDIKRTVISAVGSIWHDFSCGSWIRKKNFQVFARSRLSHTLAILLGILVFWREGHGLWDIARRFGLNAPTIAEWSIIGCAGILILLWIFSMRIAWRGQMNRRRVVALLCASITILVACWLVWRLADHKFLRFKPLLPTWFEWLIILVTVGTIGIAVWEVRFNKLSISAQEIRFARGIRLLLYELEKFCFGKDRIADPQQRLTNFIEGFVEIAAQTICGHEQMDASFMIKKPQGGDSLWLIKKSKGARYPESLEIPLDPNNTGAAGVSFLKDQIAYVPNKVLGEVWPFKSVDERYEASKPLKAWIKAKEEPFRSVLCIPTSVYESNGMRSRFGVLNLSTETPDPFVDRDFLMAECFASVLAQAIAHSRDEIASTAP